MLTPQQQAALHLAAIDAVGCELETGCPAEITIAQWALESSWGSRAPRCNAFGIKATAGDTAQVLMTTEYIAGQKRSLAQRFAVFDTLQQCFERHAVLLTDGEPYRAAFEEYEQDRDLSRFIAGIAAHYATDPNYAHELQEILKMSEVREALACAREGTNATNITNAG